MNKGIAVEGLSGYFVPVLPVTKKLKMGDVCLQRVIAVLL